MLKLIGKRLDYLLEKHKCEDKQEVFALVKTDELIKIAKFLKEMEDGAKMQVESEQSDEDEHVRFVLDKSVRRFAK